ncbi:MAG: sigma-70 family RNA polymerase sigma factor [Planctomycetota bacterium]
MTPHPRHPASLRVTPHDEAQSGVASAWREHRRWVAAVLLAHKPREAELEDLLQEVAVRLVAHAHELRDPTAIKPWLRTIAVNIARSAGRRQKVRRDARETIERDARSRAQDERTTERDEVLDATMTLPEAYREPLLLRSLRGMSYKQIADTLGVPMTTIETRLVRARRMLKEALEAMNEPRAADPTRTAPRPETEDQP